MKAADEARATPSPSNSVHQPLLSGANAYTILGTSRSLRPGETRRAMARIGVDRGGTTPRARGSCRAGGLVCGGRGSLDGATPGADGRAQNAWILAHLFLNFVCAYALAWRTFNDRVAASVAAVVFGFSPYLSAHLAGHFNLLAAWILPLCALLADLATSGCRSVARAMPLGAALAAAVRETSRSASRDLARPDAHGLRRCRPSPLATFR